MKFKITVDVDTEDKASVLDIKETASVETEETITVEEPAEEAPQTEPARTEGDEDEDITTLTTRRMSMETMENMVRDKELKIGDQLEVKLDGKAVYWDVIGIDVDHPSEDTEMEEHTYVTVQSHDLLEERQFGENGSNVWRDSSLRAYLNSDVFASRFDDEFRKHMVKTCVGYDTEEEETIDNFFLLSIDDYNPGKTHYPYYQNKRNRVKFGPDDRTDRHWTRSSIRSYARLVWCVASTGFVGSNYAASTAFRFAPACVLIF